MFGVVYAEMCEHLELESGMGGMSKNEERCQNPKPKTRKPNPNPREENGKKKRTGREKKGNGSFPILKQTRLKRVEL